MTTQAPLPVLIQGGMGVGVSRWLLAREVSRLGQLGVVSGTALDSLLVRRLQDGDSDGEMRRAIDAFPIPDVGAAVLQRYFLPNGRAPGRPYALVPLYKQHVGIARQQLTMLANFVEVFLAKSGHHGVVGINLLTKVQLPNLASLYGAMLAGVDYVLMGAGIPREVPLALDRLASHEMATLRFDVEGATAADSPVLSFDPVAHGADAARVLARPQFLAIVAANSLAATLARKASGRVDGFVVEGPTAGGHNAPARGGGVLSASGEPIYGERDAVDLAKMRELGLPFWLAGGTGSPAQLQHALAQGATGIQVGTLFAYCDESGFDAGLKTTVLEHARTGDLAIRTDPRTSPTGFPFKVVSWPGHPATIERERRCDLGYLRTAYQRNDGRLGYRCPAEPEQDYLNKGGLLVDTVGRQCVCNGLISAVGMPQFVHADVLPGGEEPALITSGDDLLHICSFLGERASYSARDVVDYLLAGR